VLDEARHCNELLAARGEDPRAADADQLAERTGIDAMNEAFVRLIEWQ
jgi:hypothetical protein